MTSIERIATFITITGGIISLISVFRYLMIKICNVNKQCFLKLIKWYHKNDPIYDYRSSLKKKDAYFLNKLNELPKEAQILFFRIYNSFRSRHSNKIITFYEDNNLRENSLYFPVSDLIEELPIKDIDHILLILTHSGFIDKYYNEDELQKKNCSYVPYFCQLKKTNGTSLKEGIVQIFLSQFGAKCYLLSHGDNTNLYEKFCYTDITGFEKVKTAKSFFAPEDISNFKRY